VSSALQEEEVRYLLEGNQLEKEERHMMGMEKRKAETKEDKTFIQKNVLRVWTQRNLGEEYASRASR